MSVKLGVSKDSGFTGLPDTTILVEGKTAVFGESPNRSLYLKQDRFHFFHPCQDSRIHLQQLVRMFGDTDCGYSTNGVSGVCCAI